MSERESGQIRRGQTAWRQYDDMVRRLLDEVGEQEWGRSWLVLKRYKVRRGASCWYVMHSGLHGDAWYRVSFGEFEAQGNPLNFKIAAARSRIKTEDLSAASLREALQQALEKGPVRWTPRSR